MRLEEEIGLSRGAIFNWFSSKQELFIALAARDNERLLVLFAEEGIEALLTAMTDDDPDWLAVYLEFGRRLKGDAALRERWTSIAPVDARERSRGWIEAGRNAGELRDDVSADDIGRFLGVILDGIAVQRALGFDSPDAGVLQRLASDALRPQTGVSSSS